MALPLPVTPQPPVAPAARPSSLSARLGMSALGSRNYFSGAAAGRTLRYPDLASFAWWTLARADVPVRLEVSERLDGPFPQPTVSVTYLSNVGINAGDTLVIDDELNIGEPLAYAEHVQPRFADGVVTFRGDTLLNRLARERPANTVIREGPMTARQALAVLLDQYGVPNAYGVTEAEIAENLPELMLYTDQGAAPLSIAALMVEAPRIAKDRPSVLDRLQEFFGMFPDYTFRANGEGKLMVVAPPWMANQYTFASTPFGKSYEAPLAGETATVVLSIESFPRRRYVWTVQYHGGPTSESATHADGTTLSWWWDGERFGFDITNDSDADAVWSVSGFVRTAEAGALAGDLVLPDSELGEFIEDELDTDGVVNSVRVTSQALGFSAQTQVLGPVDWDGDYSATNPPTDPARGTDISGSGSWVDNTARTKLWPSSSNPAPGAWIPITDAPFLDGYLSLDYTLDLAWSMSPAVATVFTKDWRWKVPEGYPRDVLLNGTSRALPASGTVELVEGDAPRRITVEVSGLHGLLRYRAVGYVEMALRRDGDQLGVMMATNFPFGLPSGAFDTAFPLGEPSPFIVAARVSLTGYGRGVEKKPETVSATYADMTQAVVAQSVGAYGLRHEEVDLGPYAVDNDMAMALAASIVLRRALPATRRHLRLAPPYVLRPDDLGKLVQHEDGWTGVFIERRYTEDNSRAGVRNASADIVLRLPWRPPSAALAEGAFDDAVYEQATYLREVDE